MSIESYKKIFDWWLTIKSNYNFDITNIVNVKYYPNKKTKVRNSQIQPFYNSF